MTALPLRHLGRSAQADTAIDWPTLLPALSEAGARHGRDGSFPFDTLALLHQAGLLGLTVPVELGGRGQGLAAASAAVNQVVLGCASTAYDPALREHLGREAARDGALLNTIRVEPELGSPTRGGLPAIVARRVPGGWRISRRKIYSTGAPGLAWVETFGRTVEIKTRVGHFMIQAGSPGLRIAAVEAVRLATSLAANHGLSRHNRLERCCRDVQCGLVHAPHADNALQAGSRVVLN